MPSAITIVTALAGFLALAAAAIYFFGVPQEVKDKMEKTALKTMGENKASYALKDSISKVPASDEKGMKELRDMVTNAVGGGLKNPVGDAAGDAADDFTKPLTGR